MDRKVRSAVTGAHVTNRQFFTYPLGTSFCIQLEAFQPSGHGASPLHRSCWAKKWSRAYVLEFGKVPSSHAAAAVVKHVFVASAAGGICSWPTRSSSVSRPFRPAVVAAMGRLSRFLRPCYAAQVYMRHDRGGESPLPVRQCRICSLTLLSDSPPLVDTRTLRPGPPRYSCHPPWARPP